MTKARDLANAGTALTSVSATELGYLDGVTSAVQTQIDAKLATSTASSTYIPKTLTTTTGDIIYASSANTPARLGIGSTSQVLTVSGGLPTWATPSSGGMTQITSGTVTNGTLSVASISGSYNHLELWIYNYKGSNNSVPSFRFNDDNTSKYPGTDTAMYINNTAGNSGYYAIGGSLTNSEATGQIILSIPWYASSNVHKNCTYTFAGKNGTNTANGSAGIGIFTVLNLGAINKITTPFDNQGGTSMSFSWELWGIK